MNKTLLKTLYVMLFLTISCKETGDSPSNEEISELNEELEKKKPSEIRTDKDRDSGPPYVLEFGVKKKTFDTEGSYTELPEIIRVSVNCPPKWRIRDHMIEQKNGKKLGELSPGILQFDGDLEAFVNLEKKAIARDSKSNGDEWRKLINVFYHTFPDGTKVARIRTQSIASSGDGSEVVFINQFAYKTTGKIIEIYLFEWKQGEVAFTDVEPILESFRKIPFK